ncbi:triose-phosphate isomerase [Buchnera aphidicola (Ceratoglyphina bambusae)]|uniref:triose-phosphate isomerase n=1 Tax=Buchnera aphidicola TaxID=9 RepID=UPI0031B80B39
MLIIGNWKLNGRKENIKNFFVKLNNLCERFNIKNDISISPPTIYLNKSYNVLKNINNSRISLTAQNIDINLSGPFTGETSVEMLKDFNVKYIIVGHSERRIHHNENNEIVSKKFYLVKKNNFIPILCVGESKRKKIEEAKKNIKKQIDVILKYCGKYSFRNSIIAYEPIWAIGSGFSADPDYVNDIHFFIKNYISKEDIFFKKNNLIIQYGGSVSEKNVQDFLSKKYIDGILVGGCSLLVETFFPIIKKSDAI